MINSVILSEYLEGKKEKKEKCKIIVAVRDQGDIMISSMVIINLLDLLDRKL